MPRNNRLSGCLDEINVKFVEQKETPKSFIGTRIQPRLSELYLLNTVLLLEVSGVDRVRSAVHS